MMYQMFKPLEAPKWWVKRRESIYFALNVSLVTTIFMVLLAYLPEWMG